MFLRGEVLVPLHLFQVEDGPDSLRIYAVPVPGLHDLHVTRVLVHLSEVLDVPLLAGLAQFHVIDET